MPRNQKPNKNHVDILGRTLEIDRYAAISWRRPWVSNGNKVQLSIGKIVRFTAVLTEVELMLEGGSRFKIMTPAKNTVMLEKDQDLFLWLLSNGI